MPQFAKEGYEPTVRLQWRLQISVGFGDGMCCLLRACAVVENDTLT
jgi:hypothetical protein